MTGQFDSIKVLVTGASGFVGMHCILRLLDEGYHVRGTLRSLAREAQLRETLAKHSTATGRLELVQADLLRDAGWAEAVSGCNYVLHVASPFPLKTPKDEQELIIPAREGTLRVLRAAAAGGVKRVVLTSSVAAVSEGYPVRAEPFNEEDWSILKQSDAYAKSKTLAERAAWDFINSSENQSRMELAVVNPGYILGPLLDGNYRTSSELVLKLMRRAIPGCPRVMMSFVDVRDMADAHLAAMTHPKAAGKRFCCVSTSGWMRDIALILSEHFASRGYAVPTRELPDILVRLAGLFDSSVRLTVPYLGKPVRISNERIRTVLGWKPRALETTVVDMAQSLIDLGFV